MASSRHARGTDRAELPVPDYEGLPLGEIEHRVRTLDEAELRELLRYEIEHGARRPVVEVLASRLHQLAASAEPASGSPAASRPGAAPTTGGSPVSPETSPEPISPPPHGTPDQPAKPKANRVR
ncbi:hypothetical protein OH768_23520 [Streptomyces sp. NBC_01622]|uniref:hypothetical protein n=1 Tax=Streptomyces sp. NBC_01622 TaxID=2975903 RepID=UPI003870324B|nr:hypothetical protein OH768_23520 [Streptomyces sp. NBC_01622]